jgi:hypothetical protein
MHSRLMGFLAGALLAAMSASAYAATPAFVVKCMKTSGPADGKKYGTFYFYLRDGFVKGYACDIPGRPCQIVSQNAQTVVFQTPGETPDTLVIDLRTGAIEKTSTNGAQWKYACKQVPYQQ